MAVGLSLPVLVAMVTSSNIQLYLCGRFSSSRRIQVQDLFLCLRTGIRPFLPSTELTGRSVHHVQLYLWKFEHPF